MNEKTTIPVIVETVLIDDHYQVETRSGRERRQNKTHRKIYERRSSGTVRRGKNKTINEKV